MVIRYTPELPDNEGRVFLTNVPNAPFQVFGRRGDDGELYVRSILHRQLDGPTPDRLVEETKKAFGFVEIVTGKEAEDLIAALLLRERRH